MEVDEPESLAASSDETRQTRSSSQRKGRDDANGHDDATLQKSQFKKRRLDACDEVSAVAPGDSAMVVDPVATSGTDRASVPVGQKETEKERERKRVQIEAMFGKSRNPKIELQKRAKPLTTALTNAGLSTDWVEMAQTGEAAWKTDPAKKPKNIDPQELLKLLKSTQQNLQDILPDLQPRHSSGVADQVEATAAAPSVDCAAAGVDLNAVRADDLVSVALFGPPGRGKSQVTNAIVGEEVSLVGGGANSVTTCVIRIRHDESRKGQGLEPYVSMRDGSTVRKDDKGNFQSVKEAVDWLKKQKDYDASDVLCIDVELYSVVLKELQMVLIDLPGYPDREKLMAERIRPFLASGKHRVDVVAYVKERDETNFKSLDELGFFEEATETPKFVYLMKPQCNVWNCIDSTEKLTIGQLSRDHFRLETNFQRLKEIGTFIDFALPPLPTSGGGTKPARLSQDAYRLIGDRMDMLYFGMDEHPFWKGMKGKVSQVTFDDLKAIVEAVRLDRVLKLVQVVLSSWCRTATRQKHTANKITQKNRNKVGKAAEAFNRNHKEAFSQFSFSAIDSLDGLFETVIVDVITAVDEGDERILNFRHALDNLAYYALYCEHKTCEEVARSLLVDWERSIQDLDSSVVGICQSDIDAKDKAISCGESFEFLVPTAPSLTNAFSRRFSTEQFLKVLKDFADVSTEDQTFQVIASSFEAHCKDAFQRLVNDLEEEVEKIVQSWEKFPILNPALVTVDPGAPFRKPRRDFGAGEDLLAKQEQMKLLSQQLGCLLSTFASAFSKKVDDTAAQKTFQDTLPPIDRAATERNDSVLHQDVEFKPKMDFKWTLQDRSEDLHDRIFAHVRVSAAGMAVTQIANSTKEMLARLVLPIPKEDGCSLHPIFVVSKLRGHARPTVVDKPSMYSDLIRAHKENVQFHVIMVVDADEAEVYCKLAETSDISVMSIQTCPTLPLNIGRKRQVTKVVAEQVLNLGRYWVIDDDFDHFVEFEGSVSRRCSAARALDFAQRILEHEVQNKDIEKGFNDLLLAATVLVPDVETRKLLASILLSPEERKQAWLSQSLDHLLIDTEFEAKLKDLRGRVQRRTALVSITSTKQCTRDMETYAVQQEKSHVNLAKQYGCILFQTPATQGIEYMDPKEFYTELTVEQIRRHKENQRRPTPRLKKVDKDKWKTDLATVGFKYEDTLLQRKLKGSNRAHYVTFRMGFVERGVRSIVNGNTSPAEISNYNKIDWVN